VWLRRERQRGARSQAKAYRRETGGHQRSGDAQSPWRILGDRAASSFPTITPSGDCLTGEVMHLVKAGEHREGIHDRLISTGSGEALEPGFVG